VENIEKFEEEVTTEPIQAEEVTETTTEDYSATEEGEVTATEETIESTAEETPTDEGTEETAVEETAAAEEAIIEEEIVEVEENMEIAETADEIENVEFSREDLLQRLFEISHDELRYALNALISVYRNDNEWCYVTLFMMTILLWKIGTTKNYTNSLIQKKMTKYLFLVKELKYLKLSQQNLKN
jgi:hypothetical protein